MTSNAILVWMSRMAVAMVAICLYSLMAFSASAQEVHTDFECRPDRICRDPATLLPARVLVRPASTVYSEPSRESSAIKSNLPPFRPWYVFDIRDLDLTDPEKPAGWYQIGDTARHRYGWIQAGDVLEWRHALVVSYTPKGIEGDRRTPALMFSDLDRMKSIMGSSNRSDQVTEILAAIERNDSGVDERYGVVMMEPERDLSIETSFYILPVVDFERAAIGERNATYLRLAAAIPETEVGSGRGVTTIRQKDVRDSVTSSETVEGTQATSLNVDIKFVFDMTGSMGPYLDAAKDAVSRLMLTSLSRRDDWLRGAVKFGLVGYNDVPAECGRCPFNTVKNWTSTGLLDGDELERLFGQPSAQAAGGGDLPEAVFEGVNEAINSAWRENAIRIVVLIADAMANPQGPKNHDLNEASVRSNADTNNIFLLTLHIRPREASDLATAEVQFRTLSTNPGQQVEAYFPVPVSRSDPTRGTKIGEAVFTMSDSIATELRRIRGGDGSLVAELREEAAIAGDAGITPGDAGALARETFGAALVKYLGSVAVRPNDLTAWTVDVDPRDPGRRSMEVRVLIEKRDLENIRNAIDNILTALRRARKTESDFFESLQAIITEGTVRSDEGGVSEAAAADLIGAGLLPKWLDSLPYKSAVQRLSKDSFVSMSTGDKLNLERELDAKLRIMRDFFSNSEIWQKLSPRHDDLEAVYAIRLTDLP